MIEKMMAEEAARRAEETTKAKKRGWSINLPNSTQTDLVRVSTRPILNIRFVYQVLDV